MHAIDAAVASAVGDLIAAGEIVPTLGYGRSELLRLLTPILRESAESAFVRIRAAAGGAKPVGGLRVRVEGEKRGARYFLHVATETPALPSETTVSPDRPAAARRVRSYVAPQAPTDRGAVEIHFGDNLPIIEDFADGSFDLIYIDPPFNTGRTQARTEISTVRDETGDRVGFKGKRYRTTQVGTKAFADSFSDYLAFLAPRLEQAHRLLSPTGSFFLHLDYREVHYAKVLLDQIFGRDSFINEIIWAYDYGARATRRWSPKHDNILWYAKDPDAYCFEFDAIDRIPYMAPGLVGEEKAARGKTPTDTWWNTIVSPTGHEKTGYPTQKPLAILKRIVSVHSRPGDRLLDFFAGSGSFGEAGAALGRDVVLVDANPEAIEVMRRRLEAYQPHFVRHSGPGQESTRVSKVDRPRYATEVAVDVRAHLASARAGAAHVPVGGSTRPNASKSSRQARLFE